jgi:DNA processing protein
MNGHHPAPVGSFDPAERLARLRLARSPGIGPKSHARLIERFGSARAAVEALPRLLATGRWPGVELAPIDAIARELEAIEAAGALLLCAGEAGYPGRLCGVDDAPPVLVCRGRVELLGAPSVAVVGARNASTHGRLLATQMARELAAAGLVVVSGLARGIDTAAHEGALDGPGSTVAVLASGVDRPYPEENAPLLERIATAGCAVGERPLGAEPQARHFPRRNRIIAGLVAGVVVVEAAPQSGSLITARLALEQGREVMAVPGSPLDPRHQGTNRLLREGAHLVESAADVLAVLGSLGVRPVRPGPPASRAPRSARGVPRPCAGPASPDPAAAAGCDDALVERVWAGLGAEPVAIDDLVRECQVSPAVVQDAVLELELAGRIERHPGNRVARKPG